VAQVVLLVKVVSEVLKAIGGLVEQAGSRGHALGMQWTARMGGQDPWVSLEPAAYPVTREAKALGERYGTLLLIAAAIDAMNRCHAPWIMIARAATRVTKALAIVIIIIPQS